MSKRMRTLRRDYLNKAITVSLSALALAGCSSAVERFGEPQYYTGNTQNQREILGSAPQQPSYQDIVNGSGGTAAGLPSASSAPVTTASIPARSSPVQTAPLPAPAVAAPQSVAVSNRQVIATQPAPEAANTVRSAGVKNWKGWTSTGAPKVTVRQGETLQSVSRKYGVPIQAVAAVNGIENPSSVRAGQTLVIPTYVYSERNGSTSATEGETGKVKLPKVASNESVVTGSIPSVATTAPHPGKKPYSQVTFADLTKGSVQVQPVKVAANTVSPRRKPGGYSEVITTASVPAQSSQSAVPAPRRQPGRTNQAVSAPVIPAKPQSAPDNSSNRSVAEARPTEPIKTQQVAAVEKTAADAPTATFRWPVRGRIISDFGAKPGGGRNEGVNLAVPAGTAVKAANDGTVIYSGNELKGYGNLVLVRHDEGWVSAYAHNSELKVKRGDKVRRGDTVALAGASGSVSQPQVHFELRKGNKPVDPLQYLPRR